MAKVRWKVGDFVRLVTGSPDMIVTAATGNLVTAAELTREGEPRGKRVTASHNDFMPCFTIDRSDIAPVIRSSRALRGCHLSLTPKGDTPMAGSKTTLRVHGETVTVERTDDESIGIQTSQREKADGEALYLGLDEARVLAYALLAAIDRDVV